MRKTSKHFVFVGQIILAMFLTTGCTIISDAISNNVQLEEIILTASSESITVDESVTFNIEPLPSNFKKFNELDYNIKYYEFFVDNTRFSQGKDTANYTFSTVGIFQVWAKYCTHKKHTDTKDDLVSNTLIIEVSEVDSSLILNVVQPAQSSLSVPQPTNLVNQSWEYTLSSSVTSASFSYVAETGNGVPLANGYFYFTSSYSVVWTVFDEYDNVVLLPTSSSGINLTLQTGREYAFKVQRISTLGPVSIKAYAPNGITDLSNYTDVYDSLWYNSQIAYYRYTANVTGYYTFLMDFDVNWTVWDEYDNKLLSTYLTIGDGSCRSISMNLESGIRYTFGIQKSTSSGDFKFKINVPNPVTDISGMRKVYDEMRFAGQRNVYTYTPNSSSIHVFNVSYNVNLQVWDNFDNKVFSDSSTASAKLNLDSSRTYTFRITQTYSSGVYLFKITI